MARVFIHFIYHSHSNNISYFQSINKFVSLSTKEKIKTVIVPNELKNRK